MVIVLEAADETVPFADLEPGHALMCALQSNSVSHFVLDPFPLLQSCLWSQL